MTRTRKMAGKETDIISSLPEDLLLYILSSLPFTEAAKTCLLSKKWLKMWQSTNTVNNNQLECKNEEAYGAVQVPQRKAFTNFMQIWTTLHKHHHLHHKFTLRVYPPVDCEDIGGACVDFAVVDGVKDLELEFFDALVEFPRRAYENKKLYQKLESLELHSCRFAPGNLAKFEALKDVTLGRIPLKLQSVKTLLSTCKWIESLSLKTCWDLESFEIEKLDLKKLVIDSCIFEMNYIRFEAPNLKVFKYCDLLPPAVSEVKVVADTIEEAHLDLSPMERFYQCGSQLRKVLQDFAAVKVLTVCSAILQVIHSDNEPAMMPQGVLRVSHLKMKIQMHRQELHGFLWFLDSCPVLTKLTIDLDCCNILPYYRDPYYSVDPGRFWQRLVVPCCLRWSLMEVEVNGFKATLDQFNACCYLICSALLLKKLSINIFNDDTEMVEKRRVFALKLLNSPKASRDLVIIIR